MKETGIKLNEETTDVDIQVKKDQNGKIIQGFHLGDTTMQNVEIILQMQPGELKEYPTLGVGIDNMLLDNDSLLYKHKIRQQLDSDGIRVNKLEIKGITVDLNASYR